MRIFIFINYKTHFSAYNILQMNGSSNVLFGAANSCKNFAMSRVCMGLFLVEFTLPIELIIKLKLKDQDR